MSRKKYTPEQIVGILREAEVLQSKGQAIGQSWIPQITTRIRAEDMLPTYSR